MQSLIAEANGRGGLDNITAIVVHVDETSPVPDRITGEMEAIDDGSSSDGTSAAASSG